MPPLISSHENGADYSLLGNLMSSSDSSLFFPSSSFDLGYIMSTEKGLGGRLEARPVVFSCQTQNRCAAQNVLEHDLEKWARTNPAAGSISQALAYSCPIG